MMNVIAERVLTAENGKRIKLRVSIGKPEAQADGHEFRCPIWIEGVHESPKWAAGTDAVQSLQLALVMIGADLDAYAAETGAMICWEGEAGTGFPMPF